MTCLASLFSGRLVRSDVAMTGEITLRGLVLPVSLCYFPVLNNLKFKSGLPSSSENLTFKYIENVYSCTGNSCFYIFIKSQNNFPMFVLLRMRTG